MVTYSEKRRQFYIEHRVSPSVKPLKRATPKDCEHNLTFFFLIFFPMIKCHKRNTYNDIIFGTQRSASIAKAGEALQRWQLQTVARVILR